MEQTRNKKFPFKIDSLSPLKPSYEHNHFANQTLDYSDIRAINTKYNAEDNQEGLPDIFTNGILGKKTQDKVKRQNQCPQRDKQEAEDKGNSVGEQNIGLGVTVGIQFGDIYSIDYSSVCDACSQRSC
eukprot:TRINITY_DN8963_c0_g1_i3.p2 TRINITY_DN8963_c0_g1~~TRINITY_DN8963_c0_g1_i3.p2  ORF type:complete len:128 (-),score=1.52 TRINITY_DN8963_c0_g1_i3:594-977(-)